MHVIRLSVFNGVHCGSQGRSVYMAKRLKLLYQRVPSRQIPICPFRRFCCRIYPFNHKTHRKRVEENANVSFFETDNQACSSRVRVYYSLTS